MSEWIVLYVLAAHFVADFVLQTTDIGLRKSKEFEILMKHICFYHMGLSLLMWPMLGLVTAIRYATLNAFLLHLPTDFTSSKLSSKYYAEGRLYAFWKVIGLDQLAHYTGLFLTLPYFLS